MKHRLKRYRKFKNKWTRCKNGHNHQSTAEARYCNQLAIEKKAGLIDDFTTQKTYGLTVNGKLICNHKVDFVVKIFDKIEVREVKGMELADWKIKRKLFEAIYPEIKYVVIKANEIK